MGCGSCTPVVFAIRDPSYSRQGWVRMSCRKCQWRCETHKKQIHQAEGGQGKAALCQEQDGVTKSDIHFVEESVLIRRRAIGLTNHIPALIGSFQFSLFVLQDNPNANAFENTCGLPFRHRASALLRRGAVSFNVFHDALASCNAFRLMPYLPEGLRRIPREIVSVYIVYKF